MVLKEKISNPNISKEIFKTCGKVFLFSSIAPALYSIVYLAVILPREFLHPYTNPGRLAYGDAIMFLVLAWLIAIFSFTIPAMILKRELLTKPEPRRYVMPLLTAVFTAIFLGIAIWLSLMMGVG